MVRNHKRKKVRWKKSGRPPLSPLGVIYQFMLITLHLIALEVNSELKCAVILFFPEKKICEDKNENILKTNSETILEKGQEIQN